MLFVIFLSLFSFAIKKKTDFTNLIPNKRLFIVYFKWNDVHRRSFLSLARHLIRKLSATNFVLCLFISLGLINFMKLVRARQKSLGVIWFAFYTVRCTLACRLLIPAHTHTPNINRFHRCKHPKTLNLKHEWLYNMKSQWNSRWRQKHTHTHTKFVYTNSIQLLDQLFSSNHTRNNNETPPPTTSWQIVHFVEVYAYITMWCRYACPCPSQPHTRRAVQMTNFADKKKNINFQSNFCGYFLFCTKVTDFFTPFYQCI